jgi:hypothetical protein
MPRKKIVFIIVEGPSDETALGVPLSRYFTGSSVYVDIIHGDMTTKFGINPLNIRKHLMKKVKSYADRNHYKRDDFLRVIQIIDTDGAYIPDANIVYDESADRPVYTDSSIMTAKYEQMIDRNERKRDNVDTLSDLDYVWGSIPYSCYYMSSNLDHALYGKRNTSDDEKEDDSFRFARRYRDDIEGFIRYLCASEFSRVDGYRRSWDYIKQDCRSLERNSNLGLCFLRKEDGEDPV